MRKIAATQISAFIALLLLTIAAAAYLCVLLSAWIPAGDFRGVVLFFSFVLLFYAVAGLVYRTFLFVCPLSLGDIPDGSRAEFVANVNILFYLLVFNSLVRSHVVPVPLMRMVYLALGAKLGTNTYSAGAILDPPLTRIGDNCIIGHDAVIFSHAIEGPRLSLDWVRLGNGVTIGAMAVVMSDVHIGDGAIVSAGAVVVKGTRIAAGEIWGGIPARRLRAREEPTQSM